MDAKAEAEHAARDVATSWPVQWLGRFGGLCYGLVYLVLAWLAVRIAFGDRATEADQRGAVAAIAAEPYGPALLWVVAIGLIAFGAWQILLAGTGFHWITRRRDRAARRAGTVFRALVALAIASLAINLLASGQGGGGNGGQQEMTAKLLSVPGGRAIVMVVGLGFVVGCGLSIRNGLARRFLRDLDTDAMSTSARRTVELLGAVGFPGKAAAYGVIGVLVCIAAVHLDPNQAGGLDKALRTLAARPYGIVLLVAVAVGFAAFGVYCFMDARFRRS